jgi:frataxin-like iron-binding protein CyaY
MSVRQADDVSHAVLFDADQAVIVSPLAQVYPLHSPTRNSPASAATLTTKSFQRMFLRLARASSSLFQPRIPPTATVLLRFKTQGSAPSLIGKHHCGRGAVNFVSPLNLEDSKTNKPRHVSATQLSNKDYVDLADLYFEAVKEYAGYVQEEKLELTVEHQVWSYLLSIRCSHVTSLETICNSTQANSLLSFQNNVITITAPGIGNYALKRHDSIRQIWFSSPILGSTSFEWFEHGENGEKQGGYDENGEQKDGYDDVVMGQWLQLSDGTNLSEILNRELRMEMEMDWFY